jgi:hypothetical protein
MTNNCVAKPKPKQAIKAYTISHALKLIMGYCTYKAACMAIDTGMVDWAGTTESFNQLDKEELEGYDILYTLL